MTTRNHHVGRQASWLAVLATLALAALGLSAPAAQAQVAGRPAAATLASIAAKPLADTLAPGTSVQLTVVGTYSDGTNRTLPASGETFVSSNPSLVTVTPAGLAQVVAGAPGGQKATITVTDKASGLVTAPANSPVITVKAVLLSIAMNPLTVQVAAGGTFQVHVNGTYSDGSVRGLTATSETFHTSNPAVATINAQGLLTVAAKAIGGTTTTISATDKATGLTTSPANSLIVTVQPTLVSIAVSPLINTLPPGGTLQAQVLGTYTDGTVRMLPTTGEAFASSNTSLATVSTSGLVTVNAKATAPNQVTISATDKASGFKSSPANSLVVTVATVLTSVSLSPLSVVQVPNGTWQLAVTGTYNNGQVVSIPASSETFTSSDPTTVTVNPAGILTVAPTAVAKTKVTISVTDTATGVKSLPTASTSVVVTSTPRPPTTSSVSAVNTTVAGNPLCTAIQPFYWEIGDKYGAMVSGSAGVDSTGQPIVATTQMPVASASKLIYASYVAQWRGAAANVTAQDVAFLNFTSGYSNMGDSDNACVGANTDAQCLTFVNPTGQTFATQNPATVGLYDYDAGHMENHAVLAGTPLANEAYASLGPTVAALLGSGLTLGYSQPLMPGGVFADSNNYGLFLRNILSGSLVINSLLGTSAVCTSFVQCPSTVAYSPIPEAWHYSLGHWVEDDATTNGDGSFSSPGAYGYYPWIEPTKTYYGLVARSIPNDGVSLQQGYQSAQCGRLLRAAWLTGVVQTGTIPAKPRGGARPQR